MGSGELSTGLTSCCYHGYHRNRDHTTKIGDSKGCMKCCVGKCSVYVYVLFSDALVLLVNCAVIFILVIVSLSI